MWKEVLDIEVSTLGDTLGDILGRLVKKEKTAGGARLKQNKKSQQTKRINKPNQPNQPNQHQEEDEKTVNEGTKKDQLYLSLSRPQERSLLEGCHFLSNSSPDNTKKSDLQEREDKTKGQEGLYPSSDSVARAFIIHAGSSNSRRREATIKA